MLFFQFGHKDGNEESPAVAGLSFLQELNKMALRSRAFTSGLQP
jgi:hypothetical protein